MGSYQVPYNQPPSYGHRYDPPRLPPNGVAHPTPGGAAPCLPHPSSCAPVNAPRPYPDVAVHPSPQRPQLGGGTFPPQPSGGYALQQPPNMSQIALRPDYKEGKQVQVRITTDFWVVAVIVSVLQFCQKFGGPKYRVQFDSPDGSGRKELDVTDQDLLPYWPRQ